MQLAVLASHGGSTLQAVIDATENHRLDACVRLVVSNNSRSGAMARAGKHAIATAHLSGVTHPDDDARDQAMTKVLVDHAVDTVLLAGYMKPLGPSVLTTFAGRIINTHPSLLPKFSGQGFFGRRVHEAVIAAGEVESGATVHYVTNAYDAGPIIAQVRVPVCPDDTPEVLEARVKREERKLVVATLAGLAAQRELAS